VWEAKGNLSRKIQRDPESILIAIEDEKIVVCIFIVEDGWNAFIGKLSVLKEYRKKGIGLSLMQKAEEIIKS
jgi:ribosomal protein S18 acetylase RimI-like enzyme